MVSERLREGVDGEGGQSLRAAPRATAVSRVQCQWVDGAPQHPRKNVGMPICVPDACSLLLLAQPQAPGGLIPGQASVSAGKIQEGKGAAQLRWASFKDGGLSSPLCSMLCLLQSLGLNLLPGFDARVDPILPFCPLD